MILEIRSINDIAFRELMDVYQESNIENAKVFYSKMDLSAGILEAEQDFYAYLRDVFFQTKDAKYYVFEDNGQYFSAFRIEPYQAGYLLEALETAPMHRRKGYARHLLSQVLPQIEKPVYSHVHKQNQASLAVHRLCGFQIILDFAQYIDGTNKQDSYTLRR